MARTLGELADLLRVEAGGVTTPHGTRRATGIRYKSVDPGAVLPEMVVPDHPRASVYDQSGDTRDPTSVLADPPRRWTWTPGEQSIVYDPDRVYNELVPYGEQLYVGRMCDTCNKILTQVAAKPQRWAVRDGVYTYIGTAFVPMRGTTRRCTVCGAHTVHAVADPLGARWACPMHGGVKLGCYAPPEHTLEEIAPGVHVMTYTKLGGRHSLAATCERAYTWLKSAPELRYRADLAGMCRK